MADEEIRDPLYECPECLWLGPMNYKYNAHLLDESLVKYDCNHCGITSPLSSCMIM